MKKITSLLFGISLVFALGSCKKVEGEGGSSTIKGSIIAKIDDGFGGDATNGGYPPAEEDVYIIYGGDSGETFYDDDTKTSYDGTFEFKYLEKGTYRIFVYSKNNNVWGKKEVVIREVVIDKKKQTVEMDPIVIWK